MVTRVTNNGWKEEEMGCESMTAIEEAIEKFTRELQAIGIQVVEAQSETIVEDVHTIGKLDPLATVYRKYTIEFSKVIQKYD